MFVICALVLEFAFHVNTVFSCTYRSLTPERVPLITTLISLIDKIGVVTRVPPWSTCKFTAGSIAPPVKTSDLATISNECSARTARSRTIVTGATRVSLPCKTKVENSLMCIIPVRSDSKCLTSNTMDDSLLKSPPPRMSTLAPLFITSLGTTLRLLFPVRSSVILP